MFLDPVILADIRKNGMDLLDPDRMAVAMEICYNVSRKGPLSHRQLFKQVYSSFVDQGLFLSNTKARGILSTLWNVGCLTKMAVGGKTVITCLHETVDEFFDVFNRGIQAFLPMPGIACYFTIGDDPKKLLLGF